MRNIPFFYVNVKIWCVNKTFNCFKITVVEFSFMKMILKYMKLKCSYKNSFTY